MVDCSRCVTLREVNAARQPLTRIFRHKAWLSMHDIEDIAREVIGRTRTSNRCSVSHVPRELELRCFLLYRALKHIRR